jgi:hypothetical protein
VGGRLDGRIGFSVAEASEDGILAARSTSQHLRKINPGLITNKAIDPELVGPELGVRYVLE